MLKPGDTIRSIQCMWAYARLEAYKIPCDAVYSIGERVVCLVLCVRVSVRDNSVDSAKHSTWLFPENAIDVMLSVAGRRVPVWVRTIPTEDVVVINTH